MQYGSLLEPWLDHTAVMQTPTMTECMGCTVTDGGQQTGKMHRKRSAHFVLVEIKVSVVVDERHALSRSAMKEVGVK